MASWLKKNRLNIGIFLILILGFLIRTSGASTNDYFGVCQTQAFTYIDNYELNSYSQYHLLFLQTRFG